MQRGSLRKQNGAWHFRYRVSEIKDGREVTRQVDKVLARVSDDYRSKDDVWPLAETILAPYRKAGPVEGSLSVTEFTEKFFLPYLGQKRKPSTVKFYREVHDNHLRDRVGTISLRDFSTRDAQSVLDAISLSHQSLLRIKTGMSAIFSYAVRLGILQNNPVREAKAEGKRTDPERYAYSLAEVEYMLGKEKGKFVLPEPARTVIAVAAFSGLRESEIRGLRWEDYTGDVLHVRRSIWRTHIGETKTPESKNAVPIIAPLRKIIDAHRGTLNGSGGWIFTGAKKRFSLNLDNLCAREIRPRLGDRWHGWHAFRRGLATNLFSLRVPAEVAKTILRHAAVSTTREHYIVLESEGAGRKAMQKLERVIEGKKRGSAGAHGRKRGANVGQPKARIRTKPA